MIRKKILTTMALSLAMVISGAITGCGNKSSQNDAVPTMTVAEEVEPTEVTTEVETQTETVVATYEVIPVQMPYSVTVSDDTILMDSPDKAGKIIDLAKDMDLTVTGEVTYGGVPVDFYYAEYTDENGNTVEGFVDGKYLEFNGVLEDSMANVTEVEGGDGEDTTEISEEATPQSEIAENKAEEFEPYIMYTNKNCNIRGRASKDATLLGTYPVNTEVTVLGIEGDWSRLEYDGCVAYIKSSLLSKEPVKTSSKGNSSASASSSGSASTQQSSDSSLILTPDGFYLTPEEYALEQKLAAEHQGTVLTGESSFHQPTQEELDAIAELSKHAELH